MNFDFSEEQKLLQSTARDYLTENSSLSHVREVFEADAGHSQALWKGVAELGWLGVAIPEEYGGAGYGYLELAMIAGEIGQALAPIPFGSTVYLAAEAITQVGNDDQKKQYLTGIASGDLIGTLATTEKAGTLAEGSVSATFADGKLTGTKLPVADGDIADFAIVLAKEGSSHSLVIVDLNGDGVARTRLNSIDATRPQAKLVFTDAPATRLGDAGSGWTVTQDVLTRAAVLMAFEQLGGADRAFQITFDFVMNRFAFGRPIGSFQSLKHRMADLYADRELARSNCYWAAWALENNDDELAVAAASAKISAGDAFENMVVDMIQMHGGVGYTWEYDCHLFYRRAKVLAHTIGTTAEWREKLITQLIEDAA
ncbi:MAG: acyl-CoA dehydrogenase family protein [Myxococcales bacterium]|nr:acyl-CoA dehydrogenase [Myxococcales bacterium]HIL80918.1 acyl-CoA dehydrogenase [Myxococcales bacterium]